MYSLFAAAPEVIESKVISSGSDIWSLSCTIVELLSGKPFYAEIFDVPSGESFL